MRKYRILEAFVISLLLIMWTLPAFAQVDTAWVRRYNGPESGWDKPYALAVDNWGNIYITGNNGIIKYDANGNQLWDRPGIGLAIVIDSYRAIYVTGMSWGGTKTEWNYFTIKYLNNGDTAWVKTYNGPGDSTDCAKGISIDKTGNVYITGSSWGDGTSFDYATIKYDTDGNELWVRRYNGPANRVDEASAITVDDFDNIYVTGASTGINTWRDCTTIKYTPYGDTVWARRYNGPADSDDEAKVMVIDDSVNVYVAGTSTGSETWEDYVIMKYDSNGNEMWVERYDGPGNSFDEIQDMGIDIYGNIYVTGKSQFQYATIKYDSSGNQLWVRRYHGTTWGSVVANGISLDNYGNIYVTGTVSNTGTADDFCTIKYDTDGNELWMDVYSPPGKAPDVATDIVVDDFGNVYITGYSWGGITAADYTTIKYVQEETNGVD